MARGAGTLPAPVLGIRLVIQVLVLAVIYKRLESNGALQLVRNYVFVHNPYESACGLLHDGPKEFLILSDNVVHNNTVGAGLVYVQGRRIAEVILAPSSSNRQTIAKAFLQTYPNMAVFDHGSSVVGPGLIDVHVHMNEPGREEWEGITTATAAAAAGGITTVIDMPLNSNPCTTNTKELGKKIALAKEKARVDVAFWAGLVPENANNSKVLRQLIAGGAVGFKSFMSPSGINDFPNVGGSDIAAALPTIKVLGVPLLLHAEQVDENVPTGLEAPREHASWVATRPERFETAALRTIIEVLKADTTPAAPGFIIHIVHVSYAGLIPQLLQARAQGLPISWETCPHYLNFASEEIGLGDTRFKCAPPIRGRANRDALWRAIKAGHVDALSTDHSPAPPNLKSLEDGNFMTAWGGISGLQYALPASWTGMEKEGMSPADMHRLWSTFPAQLAGLKGKGVLKKGAAADIVVWNPNQAADTSTKGLYHRHKVTPYADMTLKGRVVATFVGGSQVFGEGKGVTEKNCGRHVY